ncbi:MAG: arsenic resistance protein [Desulfotomaculales bacterium]
MSVPGGPAAAAWPVRVGRWFDRWLLRLIVISMAAGAALGFLWPATAPGLRRYVDLTLYLMLYPMMVGVQVEQVARAVRETRSILWSLFFNFVVSPLVGYGVALVLLGRQPDFAVGLILLAATPCAGMVAGWTGLARGNVPLSLVIVVVSLLLSIFTIPVTTLLLAGTLVRLEPVAMFMGTLLVILAPLVAGDLTRRLILRLWGQQGFQTIRPLLAPLSITGMMGIIFISIANGAPQLAVRWQAAALLVLALAIFYVLQLVISIAATRRTGLKPGDVIAVVYAVVGKNVSLALGLAVHFFTPLTAAVLAINPLIQAPALAWFYRWSARLWPAGAPAVPAPPAGGGVPGAGGRAPAAGKTRERGEAS